MNAHLRCLEKYPEFFNDDQFDKLKAIHTIDGIVNWYGVENYLEHLEMEKMTPILENFDDVMAQDLEDIRSKLTLKQIMKDNRHFVGNIKKGVILPYHEKEFPNLVFRITVYCNKYTAVYLWNGQDWILGAN